MYDVNNEANLYLIDELAEEIAELNVYFIDENMITEEETAVETYVTLYT